MDDQAAIARIEVSIGKIDSRTEKISERLAKVEQLQGVDSERLGSLILRMAEASLDAKEMAKRLTELERFKDRIEPLAMNQVPTLDSRVNKIEDERWKVVFAGVSMAILVVWEIGKVLLPVFEKAMK